MRCLIAAALLTAVLICAGCGSGSSTTTRASAKAARATKAAAASRRRVEAQAPQGSSPALRAIYATFPPPQPDSMVEGSARAIKVGERACAGKTPLEVKEEFFAVAEDSLEKGQVELIEELPAYERKAPHDPNFAAGQLAATVYAATLPEEIRQEGFRGCVYELAHQLVREAAGG